jgi:hypothetical protein
MSTIDDILFELKDAIPHRYTTIRSALHGDQTVPIKLAMV